MIRRLFFTFLAVFLCSSLSYALITKTSRVELKDGQTQISIGPEIYVIPDPEEKLTFQTVIARHQNNMRGAPNDSRLINLGLQTTPSWLIFSIINNSTKENWILDFGNTLDGRSGFAGKISLQDSVSGQETKPIDGEVFALNIKPGETKQVAVYIKPSGIMPHILNPSLSALATSQGFSFLALAVMVFMGIFAGFAILENRETNILFTIYFAINFLFLLVLERVFHVSLFWAAELITLLFPLGIIVGLALTKSFLRVRANHYMENVMILALCMFVLVLALIALLLPQSLELLKPLLIFVPSVLSIIVICGISFLQIKTQKYPGSSYMIAWGCLLGGLMLTSLTGAGLLPANEITINAYWIGLLIQGGFFIAATREQVWIRQTDQKSSQAREIHEAQSLERLRKSKESVDQARLIRVIERERELMAELREREMKRTEEMRKAKNMADKANLAKSSFLAVISHEIRTPMTGILGTVKLLTDTKLSKEQSDLIMAIKQSGDTMLTLLNDILDFEKIEKGKMDLEHIIFDLPKLVNDVTTLMGGHARDKGIALKSQIPDNFPRLMMGDPTRMRQVLLNLVNNSIKFTEKGSVTIRLQEEVLESQIAGKPRYRIFFMVEDTGIGISERAQRNLFNPFQQADETVSRKFGGTGLGLAICKSIIETMGGHLKVESEENKGSQFFFTLTFDAADENAVVKVEKPSVQVQKIDVPELNVLVVEDNEVNRKVIGGFLEKQGHHVTLCASGEEALSRCREENFDLIFVDIWMDGISGVETALSIRSMTDFHKASTPIVAISGNTAPKDVEEYMRAGMNGYLQKPVDYDKLVQSIANIYISTIESRRRSSQTIKKDITAPQSAPIFDFLNQEKSGLEIEEESHEAVESAPVIESEIDPNIFDYKLLEGLRKTLGTDKVSELLEGFTDKCDEIVRALKTFSIETPATSIKARAHELKGMAANFGVKELSGLATKIEDLAKAGQVAETLPEIEKLAEATKRAKDAIKQWLKQNP